MASKKNTKKSETFDVNTIVDIPLKSLTVDQTWNSRSVGFELDPGHDDSNGFLDLVASIRDNGQDEPITVRPEKGKFRVLAGFRRVAALEKIASDDKDKAATVRAVVRDVDDLAARSINLRENTARKNLKGADLAWGLHQLFMQYHAKGKPVSVNQLAEGVGVAQSYANKLLNIQSKVKESITADWRQSPIPLGYNEMWAISKLDADRQEEAYKEATAKKSKPEKTDSEKASSRFDGVSNRVQKLGTYLGALAREELVTCDEPTVEMIDACGLAGGYSGNERRKLLTALRRSFREAFERTEEQEETEAE